MATLQAIRGWYEWLRNPKDPLTLANERIAELEARIEDFAQLRLLKAGPEPDGSFVVQMESQVWPLIVDSLAAWFVERGGKNYVEFKAEYTPKKATLISKAPPPVGPFVVTMQRLLGKTPDEMRTEAVKRAEFAESEVARLSELLRARHQDRSEGR